MDFRCARESMSVFYFLPIVAPMARIVSSRSAVLTIPASPYFQRIVATENTARPATVVMVVRLVVIDARTHEIILS
jgi:hypothetical protein